MRTLSLYLSLYNCTLFSSLPYKRKRTCSYARGGIEDRTQTQVRALGDQAHSWSLSEAHEHTLATGKEVGRTPGSSRWHLP